MAVTLERIIFNPSLVKPKCVLGVADFFQFSAVCLQFSKNSATLQTHFGFTNIASEMHRFKAMDFTWNQFLRLQKVQKLSFGHFQSGLKLDFDAFLQFLRSGIGQNQILEPLKYLQWNAITLKILHDISSLVMSVLWHSVEKWKMYFHRKNISSNHLFSNFLVKMLFYEIFAKKM